MSFLRSCAVVVLAASTLLAISSVAPAAAVASPYRVDLRVLLLDDNSPWVDAIESQMVVEGVPYTAVTLGSATRATITDAYLSSGNEAFFQAVVGPDYTMPGLTPAELSTLRAYEAKFGVREVDGYQWANPAVGLNYAAVLGDITGTVAAVTAAGRADGFAYLNGPVPLSAGIYGYIAEPLAAGSLPAGASYTTLVGAPLPNGVTGSLIGVYSNAGVEQLIITAGFNFVFPQFKYVAHGIISWATRGVHFGYNRNNLTFHVDDAFSADSLWNSDLNCTPGEDCTGVEVSARMTPADVAYAVAWEQSHNYQFTLAYNGFYADAAADPLTQSLVANKAAFRWLNHGFEHLYQGCVQNFSVVPWQCTLDANGKMVWLPQQDIYDEITNNIALGNALGLTFDPTEYLSGEHSGLFILPQQPTDNPNFVAALTQAGILRIGSDASRDNGARQVGSATTIPRHPTALYYNTATQAQAVDEYNWLYTTRANGGSGYCEDNPATATCIAPLNAATGFTSYIVPTDAAFDMSFILSNDPRPFYAHTSNMTGDRLIYNLLDSILGTYRSVFTAATPLQNLTLTEASTQLDRQTRWAATGTSSVSGYVQNGLITISNPTGVAVPFTAPTGTTINGTTLQPYGGEVSAWLAPASTTGALPGTVAPVAPVITVTGSPALVIGTAGSISIAATGVPTPTVSLTGALPAGLSFATTPGAATISGTPAAGTAGSYSLTITAVGGTATTTQQLVITVSQRPQFTTAASTTAAVNAPFSFAIATTGVPAATITRTGTLPTGVTFTAGANGTATLAGTPTAAAAGLSYPLTLTATNSAGAVTQAFTLTISGQKPVFTSAASVTAAPGAAFSFAIATTGVPAATITRTGTLPTGVTFTAGANGTATLAGTPTAAAAGLSYPLTLTATNSAGAVTQSFTLVVSQVVTRAPQFTSAASATAGAGQAFSFAVTASGLPAPTITRSGTLPTGVTFTAGTGGTARLSGTPSSSMAGRTFIVTFTATSSAGTARQTFTLTVGQAPTITSGTLAMAMSRFPFSYTVQTTGSPAAAITMTGTLPSGLTFVDNHNGTARISGTPARRTSGTYTLVFTAKNIYGTATRTLTLRVF